MDSPSGAAVWEYENRAGWSKFCAEDAAPLERVFAQLQAFANPQDGVSRLAADIDGSPHEIDFKEMRQFNLRTGARRRLRRRLSGPRRQHRYHHLRCSRPVEVGQRAYAHAQSGRRTIADKGELEFAELRLPNDDVHNIMILTTTFGTDKVVDIRDFHTKTGHFIYVSDVCYLLPHGDLPTPEEGRTFIAGCRFHWR